MEVLKILSLFIIIFAFYYKTFSQSVNTGPDTSVCHAANKITLLGEVEDADGGVWSTNGDGSFYPDNTHLFVDYRPGNADITTGKVTLTLTATCDGGCPGVSDQMTVTFIRPYADFTSTHVCKGQKSIFNSTASASVGSIDSLFWYFNDDTVRDAQSLSFHFDSTDQLTIRQKVFSRGCIDSIKKDIRVNPTPEAQFTALPQCGYILFKDSSLVTVGSIDSTCWQFGNNTKSYNSNTTLTLEKNMDSVAARLIVTSNEGCKDTASRYVVPLIVPLAKYGINKVQNNYAARDFINQSSDASYYYWDFGDGDTSSCKDTIHTYNALGEYWTSLIAESVDGCTDTINQKVNIINPAAKVADAFTPNGDNINDVLHVVGGPLYEMNLKIYDKWGNLVFESFDQSVGWDGYTNGKKQPEGQYYYIITGALYSGETFNRKGTVYLMR